VYAPQSNASERCNRSLIAGIRAYLNNKQNTWDQTLPLITAALRSSTHQATGKSPYYLMFGQHMILNGASYELLRELNQLEEGNEHLELPDKLSLIREHAQKLTEEAFKKSAARYNLRAREIIFQPGQIVHRRNYLLSDQSKGFNAKLALKFVKAKVVRKVGNSLYELSDLEGNGKGVYHTKDIRL